MGIPGDMANHAEFHDEVAELRAKNTRLEERLASAQAQARAGSDMLERERTAHREEIARLKKDAADASSEVHALADLRGAHDILLDKVGDFIKAECDAVSARQRADEKFRALRILMGELRTERVDGG